MPTRKKSSKKVSIVETQAETPPDPCPLCGRGSAPTEPAADVLHECSDAAEPVTAETLSEEIDAAFDELPVQLPPSVRKKICARLLKKSLHPSCPEGVEVVRLACEAYLAKKEKARTASAARRAACRADKQQKEAAIPTAVGDDTEQADDSP